MNQKIDIYLRDLRGHYSYECSTITYKTCKEARRKFALRHALSEDQVKTNFAK